jgi:hypothetical protein
MTKPIVKLLYDGSELWINRVGRLHLWTVDIFPSFHEDGSPVLVGEPVEPSYHAAYQTEAEALADADSWAPWPIEH